MLSGFKVVCMLLLVYSHVLAFSVLFINSMFDIFNNHDVPDFFGIVGIVGGLLFHAGYSYNTGSLEPLIWCLGVGAVFSAYGWIAYWKGMWGGADAMMLSALGFMTPGPVSGSFNMIYVLDLITNFMVAAVGVTIIYSVYKFWDQDGKVKELWSAIKQDEKILSIIVLVGGFLSFILNTQGSNGLVFFSIVLLFAFIYEFMKLVEDKYMVKTKSAEDVEVGEVPSPDQGFGNKIRGLTEEEVEDIDDDLEVRTGVPFVPVFLFAVLLTDLTSSGIWILYSFY